MTRNKMAEYDDYLNVRDEIAGSRLSFKRFWPMAEIELKAYLTNKQMLATNVFLQPIVYFLLLAGGLQRFVDLGPKYAGIMYLVFVTPGIIAMQAMRSMDHVVFRSTVDRRWGLLAVKRLAGAGGLGYLSSLLIAPLLAVSFQFFLLLGLSWCFGARFGSVRVLLAYVLTLICLLFWVSAGLLLTSAAKNYQQRDMIISIMFLPVIFSAPVFYPLEGAARYIRIIAAFNPLSYQVAMLREALLFGNVGLGAVLTFVITLGCIVLSVRSLTLRDAMQIGER